MKKYVSKFQRILEIKEVLLKKKEEELNEALANLEIAKNNLLQKEENLQEAYFKLERLMGEKVLNFFLIESQKWFILECEQQLEQARNNLAAAEETVEKTRQEYFIAKVEKRKIEILEEKNQQLFKKYIQKEEIKFLDELGRPKSDGRK